MTTPSATKHHADQQAKSQGNGDGKKTDEHKGNGSKKQGMCFEWSTSIITADLDS